MLLEQEQSNVVKQIIINLLAKRIILAMHNKSLHFDVANSVSQDILIQDFLEHMNQHQLQIIALNDPYILFENFLKKLMSEDYIGISSQMISITNSNLKSQIIEQIENINKEVKNIVTQAFKNKKITIGK